MTHQPGSGTHLEDRIHDAGCESWNCRTFRKVVKRRVLLTHGSKTISSCTHERSCSRTLYKSICGAQQIRMIAVYAGRTVRQNGVALFTTVLLLGVQVRRVQLDFRHDLQGSTVETTVDVGTLPKVGFRRACARRCLTNDHRLKVRWIRCIVGVALRPLPTKLRTVQLHV